MSDVASRASWRRDGLSFREKFVEAATVKNVKVRQYASLSDFAKQTRAHTDSTKVSERDGSSSDDDVVPGTGFTAWDGAALLGAYCSRRDVWVRLTKRAERSATDSNPIVTMELGAGTGLATLMIASSSDAAGGERNRGAVCAMTDLAEVCELTRANARDNKAENGGAVPSCVLLAVKPLRWGRGEDVEGMPGAIRWPDVVLGADVMYATNDDVIRALASTTEMLVKPGRVAVFVACKDHRPESVDVFVRAVEAEGFEVTRVPASTAHIDFPCGDDEFEILECWRR